MTAILVTRDLIMADQCVVTMDSDMRVKVDPTHKKIFLSPDKTTVIAMDGVYDPALIDDDTFWVALGVLVKKFRDSNKFLLSLDQPVVLEFVEGFLDTKGGGMVVIQKDLRFAVKINSKLDFSEEGKGGKTVDLAHLGESWNLGCGGPILEGLIAGGVSPSEAFTILSKRDHWCSKEHTIFDLSILEDRA